MYLGTCLVNKSDDANNARFYYKNQLLGDNLVPTTPSQDQTD
jgi:hypothetical protein